jgi:hypothetical protein
VPDPVAIAGTIYDGSKATLTGLAGATVDLVALADDTVLATTTTASDGTYTLPPVATGGKPLPAEVRATASGYAPSYLSTYWGLVTAKATTALFLPANHDAIAQEAGQTWDHANGIYVVSLRSCSTSAGDPHAGLAGAQTAFVPGSTTVYLGPTGVPDASLTATTTPFAQGVDFNVPPGTVEIHETYQGMTTKTVRPVHAGAYHFLIDVP